MAEKRWVMPRFAGGYDGIIQIAPLTMPEIVAHNILPKIREDFQIPLLTIYVDEQSGKAGMVTRLEAFIDLIRRQSAQGKRRTAL